MSHLGPKLNRVTGPPASRNLSMPVCKDLTARTLCQYGSGFFGASGSTATPDLSTISTMSTPKQQALTTNLPTGLVI
ncbi:MAG TPA: hypothetical protein VET27_22165 [Mycobacterium sp.]|nr:hypothetical protein [Mycobacterium sp.]